MSVLARFAAQRSHATFLSVTSVLLSIEIFAECAKYFRNAEGAENAEGESAFSHPSNLSALSAPSAFLSLVAALPRYAFAPWRELVSAGNGGYSGLALVPSGRLCYNRPRHGP